MGCGGSNAARVFALGEAVPTQGVSPDEDGDSDKEATEAGFRSQRHWGAVARAIERDYLRDAGSQRQLHWGAVARAMERGYLRDALRELET